MVATLDEEEEMERDKSRFEVSELFGRHHKTRSNDARKCRSPKPSGVEANMPRLGTPLSNLSILGLV
jgi:hypothetical protein